MLVEQWSTAHNIGALVPIPGLCSWLAGSPDRGDAHLVAIRFDGHRGLFTRSSSKSIMAEPDQRSRGILVGVTPSTRRTRVRRSHFPYLRKFKPLRTIAFERI